MRRIVCIGDTHVGSECALWPDGFRTQAGNILSMNKVQVELWGAWLRFCNEEKVKTADTVFLLGDLCQGNNRKQWGAGTLTSDLSTQARAAVQLLKPLCEGKKVYGVIGSGYHDSLDVHLDALVIHELGGTCVGELANLKFKELDHVINIAHGVGGGAIYTGTSADKEAIMADLGAARGKIPKLSLIIRGHLHHYWYHEDHSIRFLQLPCWQAWYPFKALLKNYGKRQPDIGGVVVEIGDDITVHRYLYPTPHLYDEVIEI